MPTPVRTVLAASQDQKIENLAVIADKVLESLNISQHVAEVAPTSDQKSMMTELHSQLSKLGAEVPTATSQQRETINIQE